MQKTSVGAEALIANAQTGEYYFKGDFKERCAAMKVALSLCREVGIKGSFFYVNDREAYDQVVKYIVDNKVEGYRHYE